MHTFIFGLLAISTIQLAIAEEHRHNQLNAHLHGAAELNMAVEGDRIEIELITPADNLLGFEQQPQSVTDEQKLKQTVKTLEHGEWIQLTEAAHCQLESKQIESALIADHDDRSDGRHDNHHHQQHNQESHSEFHISYQYHCQQASALTGAELLLWHQFEGFEEIRGQLITPAGQQLIKLSKDNPSIRF